MVKTFFITSGILLLVTTLPKGEGENIKNFPIETNNQITPIEVSPKENQEISSNQTAETKEAIRHRSTECTRNYPPGFVTVNELSDSLSPQHCLEINCGLGVYVLREDEFYEKCSFCNSIRPKN